MHIHSFTDMAKKRTVPLHPLLTIFASQQSFFPRTTQHHTHLAKQENLKGAIRTQHHHISPTHMNQNQEGEEE